SAPPHSGRRDSTGPANSIYVSTPQPAGRPSCPAVAIVQDPVQAATARDNDEACSTAVSASSLRSADCRSTRLPHSAAHSAASLRQWPADCPHAHPGGVCRQRGDALQGAVAAAGLHRLAGNGKLFQMTVVAERGYFQLTQLQFKLPLFRPPHPHGFAGFEAAALRNITACFRTPSCDEVKLASGSPPPEQCPAALETQLPEPPGRIQVRQLAQTGSGNDLLSYLDSSTSHRRRRGRGTSISATASSGARLEEPVSQSSYLAASAGGRGRRRLRQDRRLRQAPSLQAS
uniref:Velvet domain-containing protein n=1 Tax=Macrostomum lignano TaxID=282301 RepID=A0A1I8FJ17_9PLAT